MELHTKDIIGLARQDTLEDILVNARVLSVCSLKFILIYRQLLIDSSVDPR